MLATLAASCLLHAPLLLCDGVELPVRDGAPTEIPAKLVTIDPSPPAKRAEAPPPKAARQSQGPESISRPATPPRIPAPQRELPSTRNDEPELASSAHNPLLRGPRRVRVSPPPPTASSGSEAARERRPDDPVACNADFTYCELANGDTLVRNPRGQPAAILGAAVIHDVTVNEDGSVRDLRPSTLLRQLRRGGGVPRDADGVPVAVDTMRLRSAAADSLVCDLYAA